MGLMEKLRRYWYICSWRVRFWWFDTQDGRRAQVAVSVLAGVMSAAHLTLLFIDVRHAVEQRRYAVWPAWVIYLIIAAVSFALSYALAPKPKAAQPVTGKAPVVEDGLSVKHHFGTVWEEELFVLAWKIVGRTAIKAKGGK